MNVSYSGNKLESYLMFLPQIGNMLKINTSDGDIWFRPISSDGIHINGFEIYSWWYSNALFPFMKQMLLQLKPAIIEQYVNEFNLKEIKNKIIPSDQNKVIPSDQNKVNNMNIQLPMKTFDQKLKLSHDTNESLNKNILVVECKSVPKKEPLLKRLFKRDSLKKNK